MSDQADVTGRGTYRLVEALTFAVEALSELPIKLSSIARTLKRTEGATRQKAFSLGLSLDSRA
jgi:hypothetical protein